MMDAENGELVDDLATLNELDENRLLVELKRRYAQDVIYTNIGDILVAINPYKSIPIYGQQAIDYHIGLTHHTKVRPHIYAIADRVYQNVFRTGSSQCCLVSGESGAGKTESTKLLIRHIVHQKSQHIDETLHEKIIQVNPLLEAFGNAETLVNDNSSRFGKYIQINLDPTGAIAGAQIYQYLLEKSRVVRQGDGERNFHVFYNLFAGLNPLEKQDFLLDRPESYRIMRPAHGPVYRDEADFLSNRDSFIHLRDIMRLIGFSQEEVHAIFGLLATILHITNIRFTPETEFEGVYIENEYELDIAASLLGVNVEALANVLISNVTLIRGDDKEMLTLKTMEQAEDGRDAIAKAMYSRLFAWIVRCINRTLSSKNLDPRTLRHVGILDIAGFENFEDLRTNTVNSFEQLCINITNEQLQFYFNQAIFDWEIKSYEAEGIKHSKIRFTNNGPVLGMLLQEPTKGFGKGDGSLGLLSLLDEESRLVKTASDISLIEKFNKHLSKHECYKKCKHKGLLFTVCHYAGEVRYSAKDFLVKNQDTVSQNMAKLLCNSDKWMVYELFTATMDNTGLVQFIGQNTDLKRRRSSVMACKPPDMAKYAQSMSRKAGKKLKQKMKNNQDNAERQAQNQVTVSSHFRNSLADLMEKLQASEPHFIRCIKPNGQKSSHLFHDQLVMAQLRYSGVLETTRIRRLGFPSRLPFNVFMQRYKFLTPKSTVEMAENGDNCATILKHQGLKDWQIGKSRVFLKYWHTEALNNSIDKIRKSTVTLQNFGRMFTCRRRFLRMKENIKHQTRVTHDFCLKVEHLMNHAAAIMHLQSFLAENIKRQTRVTHDFCLKVEHLMNHAAAIMHLQSNQDKDRHEQMVRDKMRRLREKDEQVRQQHVNITRPNSDPTTETTTSVAPSNPTDTFIGQRVIPKGIHSVHLRKVREGMARLTEYASYEEFQQCVMSEVNNKLTSLDRSIWAKVIYMEGNKEIGKFYLSQNVVTINGSTDTFQGTVIGVNRYNGHAVDDATADVRSRIQEGLSLRSDKSGDIHCTRLGACPVTVYDHQNPQAHCFSADVLNNQGIAHQNVPLKVFDVHEFKSQIGLELRQSQYSETKSFDRTRLERLSLTCITFGSQGRELLDCASWFCVCNLRALTALDNEEVIKEVQNTMVQLSLGNGIDPTNLAENQQKNGREWSKLNHRPALAHKEPPLRRARQDLRNNNEKIADHMPYSWSASVPNDTDRNDSLEEETLSILDQSYIQELVGLDSDEESKVSQRIQMFKKFEQNNNIPYKKGRKLINSS